MHPNRRRKKRPNYGLRTVEVSRGPNGFGFTISGQQPCILSCIVPQSPADQAGLKAGDFLISVNGTSVSKSTHDAVANLIGSCFTPIRMTIAEHYYSDSSSSDSDENVDHLVRMVNTRRPKHRVHRLQNRKLIRMQQKVVNPAQQNCAMEDEGDPIEYRAIVGYLGTIEMPRQVVPGARLQTVCSCVRKLRQEKRAPTAVLMTVLPTCLTLKNASNHILAIYPTNRVVYISSSMEKDCRYFGLVTSAVNDTRCPSVLSSTCAAISSSNTEETCPVENDTNTCTDGQVAGPSNSYSRNGINTSAAVPASERDEEVDISNSCHVFVTDPKLALHAAHAKKAEQFHIECTEDSVNINGNQYCVEFPRNALYIVSLVQNLYRLQHDLHNLNGINGAHGPAPGRGDNAAGLLNNDDQLMANSPQPSASSNSDSGIGFRDDCGNVSDRILVVEFPYTHPFRVQLPPKANNNNLGHCSNINNNRPINIVAHFANTNETNGIESIASSSKSALNNNVAVQQRIYHSNLDGDSNNVRLNNVMEGDFEGANGNAVANVRANDSLSIKNILERSHNDYWIKQNNTTEVHRDYNSDLYQQQRLAVRAIASVPLQSSALSEQQASFTSSAFNERPVDVHAADMVQDTSAIGQEVCQNDIGVFKTPRPLDVKRAARRGAGQYKTGVAEKEERDVREHKNRPMEEGDCSFYAASVTSASGGALASQSRGRSISGSWQNLALLWSSTVSNSSNSVERKPKLKLSSAHSEPDVRRDRCVIPRTPTPTQCDERINCKDHPDDPTTWSTSFEKLLECPWGLQTFANFLKKEFSAENIYFWTACERFKRLNPGLERTAEAQRIYQQHLCVGAPEAVNVDSKARQYTEQALQDGCPSLFNHAQKQIFNLMKFDSYTRFLKSDLYNQCLSGNVQKYDLEAGLLTYPLSMIASGKLKKSLSNAEDRRRKSLLPWHRKNRSKSKDRGELEYNNNTNSCDNAGNGNDNGNHGNETSHSVSSLTSIDFALHAANHESNLASMASIASMTSASIGTSGDDTASVTSSNSARTALCRVILTNGSTTVVQIQPSETIEQLIGRLLHKRGINYRYYVVHSDKHEKPVDISEPSQKIAGCEVTVEWRVSFKLYLPNDKIIGVKSKCNKKLVEILRPILVKYSFNIDQVVVFHNNEYLDVNTPITVLDGARITIQLKEANSQDTLKRNQTNPVKQTTLEEITNRVYEDILHEKANSVTNSKSERGSVKSEDWGSEHSSSGIFGRFLRRDSAIHERKKKQNCSYKARCNGQLQTHNQQQHQQQQQNQHLLSSSSQSSVEDVATTAANDTQIGNNGSVSLSSSQVMKKPLIAKWKSGVKLQVACASESEEFLEGVSRAQRSRLEDQRGIEINYEIPEFLKSKEQMNKHRKILPNQGQIVRSPSSKINTAASLDSSISRILKTNGNYENRSILVSSITQEKFVNSEVAKYESKTSPTKVSPSKVKSMDPPPLPPKPKILPMRPSNWGGHSNANGSVFKLPGNLLTNVASRGIECASGVVSQSPQTSPLFLEQPASSFV